MHQDCGGVPEHTTKVVGSNRAQSMEELSSSLQGHVEERWSRSDATSAGSAEGAACHTLACCYQVGISAAGEVYALNAPSNKQFEHEGELLEASSRLEAHILDALRDSNAELKKDLANFSTMHDLKGKRRVSNTDQTDWVLWQQNHKDELLSVFADFSKRIESEKEKQISDYILSSLHFPRIRDRELRIHRAHARTFNWIFDKSDIEPKPFSNFMKWIRGQDDPAAVYWIAGKPGS